MLHLGDVVCGKTAAAAVVHFQNISRSQQNFETICVKNVSSGSYLWSALFVCVCGVCGVCVFG